MQRELQCRANDEQPAGYKHSATSNEHNSTGSPNANFDLSIPVDRHADAKAGIEYDDGPNHYHECRRYRESSHDWTRCINCRTRFLRRGDQLRL